MPDDPHHVQLTMRLMRIVQSAHPGASIAGQWKLRIPELGDLSVQEAPNTKGVRIIAEPVGGLSSREFPVSGSDATEFDDTARGALTHLETVRATGRS